MASDRDRKMARLLKRVVPIEEAEDQVKILVYGRNKQGKTRFAASAPNVLILDVNERGTRSAKQFKGGKVLPVNKWEDIELMFWHLKSGDHNYESVAIDTITAMQRLCMAHVLGEEAERDINKDAAMPSKRDWGKLAELMRDQILRYRNLPLHVIFTAQERVIGDEEEGTLERVPDLSGANRGVALGSVEIIGRIYQKEVRGIDKKKKKEVAKWEPRMLVGPHDEFATGSRLGPAVPRIIRNPTMDLIIKATKSTSEEE